MFKLLSDPDNVFLLGGGAATLVPLLLLSPPFFPIILFLSAPANHDDRHLLDNVLSTQAGAAGPSSPIRKSQQGKEPFEQHISKLLQRTSSQPIMKAAAGAELTGVDCLKILTRSVKVCVTSGVYFSYN
jgi:hypothetical protein